jgi:hypothetical protein
MLIVKSSRLPQRGARSPQAMVGAGMPLRSVREGSQAEQEVPCCLLEAGTIMLVKHFESSPVLLVLQLCRRKPERPPPSCASPKWHESCFRSGCIMLYYVQLVSFIRYRFGTVICCRQRKKHIRACLVWVLKFNKYCSTFVLFDKKFLILY